MPKKSPKNKRKLGSVMLLILCIAIIGFFTFLILKQQQLSARKVPAEDQAAAIKKECSTDQKISCYVKKFEEIARKDGYEKSFNVLLALQKIDHDANECHFIAHGIGWGTYERDPSNAQRLLGSINPSCGYGATMGIMEKYVANFPNGKLTDKNILTNICNKDTTTYCNHILGHMVIVETKNDIPAAIKLCSELQDSIRQESCDGGIFMEHASPSTLSAHGYDQDAGKSSTVRLYEMEQLCRSFGAGIASACWSEISQLALEKYNYHPKEALEFCNTAQTENAANLCKRRIVDILSSTERFDLDSLKNICSISQPTDPEFMKNCYGWLVEFKLTAVSYQNALDVIDYCSSLPQEFKYFCLNQIGSSLKRSGRFADAQNICRRVSDDLRDYCLDTKTAAPI